MLDFINSIFAFWSQIVNGFASSAADFSTGNNLITSSLTFLGIENVVIGDILVVGLSLGTFALLIYFSFKIVKYCFRFFANIFGGWL
jgi:hypothetical protein